jgi:lipopolysaccharide/colanic/teichoic acid biosynthesis glycosyltransferase
MEIIVSNSAFALAQASEELPVRRCFYQWIKRPLDLCLSLVGLALSAPLIAGAAVLVKLSSRGPIFYSQVRLGLSGRPFLIYKIRSMYQNSEAHTGPCWSTKGDRRITPVGRFLRWSHIDELPQMWNIVVGDMSLIGPRPERPEMIPGLERAIPRYRERLLIRPGLSGLAQVQLPPDTDQNSVRIKLAHDLCYLEHCSFWLDCRIFVATIFHVCGTPYEMTRHLCALPGGEVLSEQYTSSAEIRLAVPDLQAV